MTLMAFSVKRSNMANSHHLLLTRYANFSVRLITSEKLKSWLKNERVHFGALISRTREVLGWRYRVSFNWEYLPNLELTDNLP
jgi:hypothetical protein